MHSFLNGFVPNYEISASFFLSTPINLYFKCQTAHGPSAGGGWHIIPAFLRIFRRLVREEGGSTDKLQAHWLRLAGTQHMVSKVVRLGQQAVKGNSDTGVVS